MELSIKTKEQATQIFKQGDVAGAIEKYKYAISQAPESEVQHRAILHNNVGMCLMKLHDKKVEQPPEGPNKVKGMNSLNVEMSKGHKEAL